jgi:hypothetical protein
MRTLRGNHRGGILSAGINGTGIDGTGTSMAGSNPGTRIRETAARDRCILDYARAGYLSVIDATP